MGQGSTGVQWTERKDTGHITTVVELGGMVSASVFEGPRVPKGSGCATLVREPRSLVAAGERLQHRLVGRQP